MFFTSPAFAFLFLPLALAFYATLGKSNRSFSILVISWCYQLLMVFINPLIPICFLFLILYTFLTDRLLQKKESRWLLITFCIIPFLLLILLRHLPLLGLSELSYPYGFAFGVLSAVSFLADCYHGQLREKRSFFDICRYLLFFPIMTAGPVIQYRDFARITEENRIRFGIHNLSIGARLFMLGFIKRIAVGAVLMETYVFLIRFSVLTPNLFVAAFGVILLFFAIYFTLSGYAEMGVGIARMFGFCLSAPYPASLSVATPKHYLNHFLASFGDWIQRYLIRPFPILAKDGRIYRLLKSCIYCLFLALFLRSDWYVIPAVIPLILLSYVLGKPSRRQAIKNQSGFRFLSSILSLFFIAVFWALIHAEGFGPFWRYIITLRTDNMEYRVNLLLATLSNLKYILVLAIALLILLSYSKAFRKWLGNRSIRVRMIVEMLLNFLLLALFLFSILFFLPQFPAYNLSPYLHLLL